MFIVGFCFMLELSSYVFFSLKSFTVVGWKMNNEMNIWVDDEVLDEELG